MDFDPRYGYYEVRFGGNAKVLQSYFAVAKIVILLCNQSKCDCHMVDSPQRWITSRRGIGRGNVPLLTPNISLALPMRCREVMYFLSSSL